MVILGTGEELWMRFVPKYLEALGASVTIISLYGVLRNLLDGVYQYPGGWLADRLGRRKSLVVFTLLAIAGYGLYMAAPDWRWVLAGTVFVMAWSSLSLPAIFAVIGDNLSSDRRAIGFSVQSILKRIPVVVGAMIGGWLIVRLGMVRGVRVGLAATIVLALVSILIVRRWYVEKPPGSRDSHGFLSIWRGMDRNLKRLLVADILARWAEGIPDVFIVLYVTNVLGLNPLFYATLIAVQRLTSILIYLPIAKLSDRMNRKPFVLLTFAFFALFPLALARAHGLMWITLAFVVAGLREIGEPARKALIVDLASASARGRAVGAYYLVRGLAVFAAPFVGGVLWKVDPSLPFLVAFVVGVAGLIAYAVWGPGSGTHNA